VGFKHIGVIQTLMPFWPSWPGSADRTALFRVCVVVAVYLYGAASTSDYRKTVPQIRAGEYEGLQEKVRYFMQTSVNVMHLVGARQCKETKICKGFTWLWDVGGDVLFPPSPTSSSKT